MGKCRDGIAIGGDFIQYDEPCFRTFSGEEPMKYALLVVIAVVISAAAGLGQDSADDLKKMAGTWKTTLHEADGKTATKDEIEKTQGKLVVKADKYDVFFGDKAIDEGTIKLDASKKPRQIDAITKKGGTMKGIYKIDGDKMTVCFAQPGKDRPTEFKTQKGTGQMLLGYERVKK
jgi:uncharacterized protein (TIGR03067 family)